MGLTTGGTIGAETGKTLEDYVPLIDKGSETVKSVRGDVIILCHSGPIATPEQNIVSNTVSM